MRNAARSLAVAVLAVAPALGPAAAQGRAVPASRAEAQLSYAPIVRQVSPAVVNVSATRVIAQRPGGLFDDPLFRQFFGGQIPLAPRERMQRSLGSGVIVGAEGLVITNNHVINNMTDVRVSLVDQREFDADIILTDPRSDLAVLKIRGAKEPFATLPLGDAEQAEVGDLVLAVGNPYGLGQTVTTGIVSAIRRVQLNRTEARVFIQTDAAINQGNSGGALVDMHGRLLGINTAIFSRSGGSDGIGFATPAPLVKLAIEAAKAGAKAVRRPWLGAEMQSVTREIGESLGLDRPGGALVAEISEGSPAARAGLREGDLVVALDGRAIEDATQFNYLFAIHPMGTNASLKVRRGGREVLVPVRVEAAPETVPRDERLIDGSGPFTGARVANLSPALAEELGIEGRASGVIVTAVTPGSIADRLRLQKGDRVLAVNERRIASTAELERANTTRQSLWRISVERGGQVFERVLRF